jgi:hypothetical protein
VVSDIKGPRVSENRVLRRMFVHKRGWRGLHNWNSTKYYSGNKIKKGLAGKAA